MAPTADADAHPRRVARMRQPTVPRSATIATLDALERQRAEGA